MRNLSATLRIFVRDRHGAVAVTSAILMTSLVGFTALGVDVGSVYTDRRKAQSVADLAAMAAVGDISNADKAAAATLAKNKLPDSSYEIQYGKYVADPAVAPANRFTPTTQAQANAARVSVKTKTPLFFSRMITGKDSFDIQTTATATQSQFANFAIGSRLLSLNNGIINSVLGGLLGTTLSLSVMDYNALASLKVDAFTFANALATRLNLTAGTYNGVLAFNAKAGDVIGALYDAARAQNGSLNTGVTALNNIAQSMSGITTKISVQSLIDLGDYNNMAIGQTPKVSASMTAFDVVSAIAQLANGANQGAVNINVSLAGIASATLKVAVGERPQGSSWVTFGAAGATVRTAQTRILLTVSLLGTAPYSVVSVPIYIEIASGKAILSNLTCGFPNVSTSTATLAVTPGIIDAWIGNVPNNQFTSFSSAPAVGAATLLDLALLKVTAQSHVSISNMTPTSVNFSYSDIQNVTKKTVGTTSIATSLLSSLLTTTQLNVNVLGLGLGLGSGAITSGLSSLLTAALSPIDQLLASVLQTLGVGIGQADVWVSGIRCDGAVLVI